MNNKKLLLPTALVALLFGSLIKANNLTVSKAETVTTDVVFNSTNFHYVNDTTGNFATCDSNARWWGDRTFFVPEGVPFYRAVDDVTKDGDTVISSGDAHLAQLETVNPVLQVERYVTFYMGGGNNENLYAEVIDKGVDGSENTVIKTIKNDYFNNPRSGEALFLRVVDVNEYLNHYLSVRIVDGFGGGFGIINFGGLKFNQTVEQVKDSIDAYRRNAYNTQSVADKNAMQYQNMITTMVSSAEYSSLISTTLQDYESIDFEGIVLSELFDNKSTFENGTVLNLDDKVNAKDENSINKWSALISSENVYEWAEHMPFNKKNNKFFSTHPSWTGIVESAMVLLRSKFTIEITDPYMAFRIGGARATIRLIDATNNETLYDFNPAGGTNPFFKDAGVGNIIASGTRVNTMTEVYVNVSSLVDKTVYLEIGEHSTGGGWGLAYIDDIRFNLSASNIKVELDDNTISQHVDGIQATYYGVVIPGYVRGTTTISEEKDSVYIAFNFLTDFYNTVRNYNATSLCQLDAATRETIVNKYNAITDEVAKTIINNSDDFNYNNLVNPGAEYYLNNVVVTKGGVNETINYLSTGFALVSASGLYLNIVSDSNTLLMLIAVVIIALIGVSTLLFVKKRKSSLN